MEVSSTKITGDPRLRSRLGPAESPVAPATIRVTGTIAMAANPRTTAIVPEPWPIVVTHCLNPQRLFGIIPCISMLALYHHLLDVLSARQLRCLLHVSISILSFCSVLNKYSVCATVVVAITYCRPQCNGGSEVTNNLLGPSTCSHLSLFYAKSSFCFSR
jgi:hypothetical protein